MEFKISKNEAGERADVFLAKKIPDISRAQIQQAIRSGVVKINRKSIKSSYILKIGDKITVEDKFLENLNKPLKLKSEKIPLKVIFEDDDLLVIDKPSSLVTHPGAGNKSGTVVNALLNYIPEIKNVVQEKTDQFSLLRPGIVHRLDKDTSGLMVIAKNRQTLSFLSSELQNKQFNKYYLALVYGWLPEGGKIESYLARDKKNRKKIIEVEKEFGKNAISNYKAQKYLETKDGKYHVTLAEIEILTGRTHQIRVQMKGIGFPILGDAAYVSKESERLSRELSAKRQMLHAARIRFRLPSTKKYLELSTSLPEDFQKILDKLKKI